MPQTAVAEARVPEEPVPQRHLRRRHWLLLGVGILVAFFATECIVLALNWPFNKQNLIDILQERSARTVTIDRFYRTYFPPGCVAEHIQFLHRVHKERTPLITVQGLVMTTSWARLLALQHRLTLVRIFDMHVTVPPSEPGKPNPIMPLTYSEKGGASIVVDRTIADGAVLDFLSKDPGKKPFRLVIDKLRLDGLGNNEPMFYRTIISNEMPPGKIRSTGVFGTWNPKDPGSTPLHGTYRFDDANLAAFGGVSGTLFSTGKFSGTLRHVNVDGTTDIPNFKVTDTSHSRRLSTQFQAVVDGTKGDTFLNNVTAHFDSTTVYFKGSVAGQEGQGGKLVSLDMSEPSGRIEDLLDLFISAKTPPMTGSVVFRGHVDLPPGPAQLVERMKLRGDFGVAAGKFTDKGTEGDITRLSDSAEKHAKGQKQEDPETVLSDLKGHAVADDGVATLSNLSFTVPGASATLHGTYNLVNYKIDLHGVLFTTGQPGDATTGFKSFFVKAITPFFKRKHAAKVVPFKITGNYSNPRMDLDFGSNKK
ncbi:MAG TPA: AsmA-like C-terminal region-containing protein [Bryobacteraceae bacterium]|nr:AsmA-like C-terminal region-containing protein [Bryobacteraceae bacterium]